MKTRNHIILTFTLVLVAFVSQAALEMTSTNNIIVGDIYSDFVNTNSYHFINKGDAAIEVVRLLPTCPCIKADTNRKVIKPGQQMTLTAIFDANGISGEFSRGLWLLTSDSVNNKILLRVSGRVIPLFHGFPQQQLILLAADESVAITNHFTFTATTTNCFLNQPQCEGLATNCFSLDWKFDGSGASNQWHLTTFITPDQKMNKHVLLRFPVTAPTRRRDQVIRIRLTVDEQLRVSPSKLVITTLKKPLNKGLYVNICLPDAKPELLTVKPDNDEIKLTISPPEIHDSSRFSRFSRTRKQSKRPRSRTKTRLKCSVTISPAALKELMKMKTPAITFHYPQHQPVEVPIILYQSQLAE